MKFAVFGTIAIAAFACTAMAQTMTAAREGTKIIVEFTATAKTTSRFLDDGGGQKGVVNALTTSSVNRVLKGRCQLEAGAVGNYGLDGPTKQQEQAMNRKDPGMVNLEREHAKCKGNQTCLMALAQQMSAQSFEPKTPKIAGAIQVWYPKFCSGSFSANDVFDADIKDGPGLSYKAKSTITGAAQIPEGGEKRWLGMYIEHDLAKSHAQYRLVEAPPVLLDKRTVRTGYQAGTTESKVPVGLTQRVLPNPWGPVNGPLQSGSLTRNIDGGTLTIEWRINH